MEAPRALFPASGQTIRPVVAPHGHLDCRLAPWLLSVRSGPRPTLANATPLALAGLVLSRSLRRLRRPGRRAAAWHRILGSLGLVSPPRRRGFAGAAFALPESAEAADGVPPVEVSPSDHGTEPAWAFRDMRLHPKLAASLARLPFEQPTAIQAHVVPLLMARHDVMASGQTGSGKTLMFLLPVLHLLLDWGLGGRRSNGGKRDMISPAALVLAPTRELATQIFEEAAKLCRDTGITPALAYGGADVRAQLREMSRGCDLLIATPGRLQMFVDQRRVDVRSVAALVVDEADRMLDMGFEPQLTAAVRALGPPPSGTGRVSLMCSATFPLDIQRLASRFLSKRYIFVTVGRVGAAVDSIEQSLIWADEDDKPQELLSALGAKPRGARTLVFCNTKSTCDQLAEDLGRKGWNAEAIHGDRSQSDRERVLAAFRNGRTTVLVATDVAARGLDVRGVEHVVQFDTATDSDDYVHRIGRTGRAGAEGFATALVNGKQLPAAPALVRTLADAGQAVPLWLHGMAHASRARLQEQREAIEAGGGGLSQEEPSAPQAPRDAAFGGQDFRREAAAGSWGKERDLSFASFDEDAYRDSAPQDSDNDEGKDEETDDEEASKSADSLEKDDSVEDEPLLDDDEGELDSSIEDEALDEAEAAPEPWTPPVPPSPELRRELQKRRKGRGGEDFGEAPEAHVMRPLQQMRSQRLYFEYLGLFSPEAVAAALSGPTSREAKRLEGLRKILMVAEKPSIAEALAKALSPPNRRSGPRKVRGISRAIPLFEFAAPHVCADGVERECTVRVTSTIGHIFSLSFEQQKDPEEDSEGPQQKRRQRHHPREFFELPVVKQVESSSDKLRVVEHLRAAAAGCDELCLWLDCDREGENIAHEVMAVTRSVFPDVQQQVRRARFSSLAPAELRAAARELPKHLPDAAVSRSVDARQELDLRAGVAFSRQLTAACVKIARRKLGGQEGRELRLISWGPCQSPTLWFVCKRYEEVASFQRRPLFKVAASASEASGGRRLDLKWLPPQELQLQAPESGAEGGSAAPRRREEQGATADGDAARAVLRKVRRGDEAVVADVSLKERTVPAPAGLNTVALLQACSKALGVSPKKAMQVAEKLYSSGYISYPRTETTKYSAGFDVTEALEGHARHPGWGRAADRQLRQLRRGWRPPPVGRDMGDHPPITPIRPATKQDLGGGLEWRIYEFISRHFLGSLSEPLRYRSVVSKIAVEGSDCLFEHSEVLVDEPGFGGAMPWVLNDLGAERQEGKRSPLTAGTRLNIDRVDLSESMTSPPPFLQEHELIGLMDEHGIGTDASMATHVATICDRNYVAVVDELGEPLRPPPRPGSKKQRPRQRGRFLVPTPLGLAFMEAVEGVDADLVSPPIRAKMEEEVGKIADDGLDKDEVLARNLDFFKEKFGRLVRDVGNIQDSLQEALEPTKAHLRRLQQQGCFGDSRAVHQASGGSASSGKARSKSAPLRRDGHSRGGRPMERPASAEPPRSQQRRPRRDRSEARPSSDFDRHGSGSDQGSVEGPDRGERRRPPRGPASDGPRGGNDNWRAERFTDGERGYRGDARRRPRGRNDDGRAEGFDGEDRGHRGDRRRRFESEPLSSRDFDRPRGRNQDWESFDGGDRGRRGDVRRRLESEPPPSQAFDRPRGRDDEWRSESFEGRGRGYRGGERRRFESEPLPSQASDRPRGRNDRWGAQSFDGGDRRRFDSEPQPGNAFDRPRGRNDEWGAESFDGGDRRYRGGERRRFESEPPPSQAFDRPRGRNDDWRAEGFDREDQGYFEDFDQPPTSEPPSLPAFDDRPESRKNPWYSSDPTYTGDLDGWLMPEPPRSSSAARRSRDDHRSEARPVRRDARREREVPGPDTSDFDDFLDKWSNEPRQSLDASGGPEEAEDRAARWKRRREAESL